MKVKKKFACYLVDVRNDGGSDPAQFNFHRQVVKIDIPLDDLIKIGQKMLRLRPKCDRITIVGSGKARGTVWLYDSANKIKTQPL